MPAGLEADSDEGSEEGDSEYEDAPLADRGASGPPGVSGSDEDTSEADLEGRRHFPTLGLLLCTLRCRGLLHLGFTSQP
jgi:hypothetical protein